MLTGPPPKFHGTRDNLANRNGAITVGAGSASTAAARLSGVGMVARSLLSASVRWGALRRCRSRRGWPGHGPCPSAQLDRRRDWSRL